MGFGDHINWEAEILSRREELRNRIPVPLELFWKLEINRKETMEALEELNEFYKEFNDALEKFKMESKK